MAGDVPPVEIFSISIDIGPADPLVEGISKDHEKLVA